jgi:glycosyltransferase involved in cell wall biosynthesis
MNWKSDLIRSRAGRFVLERVAKFYDQFVCTAGSVRRQARMPRKLGTGLRFSVGIPHYNRGKLIYRPLFNLLNHPAVDEVVIVDDGSREEEYQSLKDFVDSLDCGNRVKVFRREENRRALLTKLECVERSSSDWVLVLDSDNTVFRGYLDTLSSLGELDPKVFYCASWAFPFFPFHKFSKLKIDFESSSKLTSSGLLKSVYIFNDGNYLANKKRFINVSEQFRGIVNDQADVALVNYGHLSSGGSLQVIEKTGYFHRVHEQSRWLNNPINSKKRISEIYRRLENNSKIDMFFLEAIKNNKL